MGMLTAFIGLVGTNLNKAIQAGKEFGEKARKALVIENGDARFGGRDNAMLDLECDGDVVLEDGSSLHGTIAAMRAAGYGEAAPPANDTEHPSGEFEIVPEPTEMADPEPLFIGGPTEPPQAPTEEPMVEVPAETAAVHTCGYVTRRDGHPQPPCTNVVDGDAVRYFLTSVSRSLGNRIHGRTISF